MFHVLEMNELKHGADSQGNWGRGERRTHQIPGDHLDGSGAERCGGCRGIEQKRVDSRHSERTQNLFLAAPFRGYLRLHLPAVIALSKRVDNTNVGTERKVG